MTIIGLNTGSGGFRVRLAKWRNDQGMTQRTLADELGCSQATVSLMERANDPQIPERSLMIRIHKLTRGFVAPNDFYDLPALGQFDLPMADAEPAPLFDRAAE